MRRKMFFFALPFILLDAMPAYAAIPGESFWIVSVFAKGGIMMWAILLCSILALAVFFERLSALRRRNIIHPQFLEELKQHWERREFAKALKICRKHDVPISRILRAGLLRSNLGVLEVERAVESAGAHEASWLMARLRPLGVIASLTPMLGLLGTVSGLIHSFNAITAAGPGNPTLVAAGIAEALIATAAGLGVGVLALGAYHFLRGRTERLILEMEAICIDLIEEILALLAETPGKKAEAANEIPKK